MLILSLALALTTTDPDGVVATARATPLALDATAGPVAPAVTPAGPQAAAHGLTTDEQIDRWISARSPDERPFAGELGPGDDRKAHGYVEAGVGSGGYRSYGGGVSLPIGEEGRLDLHYGKVEGERFHGFPAYGRPGHGSSPFDAPYGGFGARQPSAAFGAGARWESDRREAARD
jgi:hypothetical protein